MNDYGPLFDHTESFDQAENGMTLANGADRVQKWKEKAHAWWFRQPHGREFTADDLIRDIGLPDDKKNNVVGAWINAQHKQRKIRFGGRYKKSSRVSRHTGLLRVWEIP